jgi:hypothetical protein
MGVFTCGACQRVTCTVRDFRLPPQSVRGLCSSGLLRRAYWFLLLTFQGSSSPIFKVASFLQRFPPQFSVCIFRCCHPCYIPKILASIPLNLKCSEFLREFKFYVETYFNHYSVRSYTTWSVSFYVIYSVVSASHKKNIACSLKTVPIGSPKTSANKYQVTLRNNPEERRPQRV